MDIKPLPSSKESEQAILCSLLLSPKWGFEQCLDKLKPEHFHISAHRILYEAMLAQHKAGEPVGILELCPVLQQQKNLELIGGPAYLAEIQMLLPSAANLLYYIEVVMNLYHRRELLRASRSFEEAVFEEPEELASAVQTFEKAVECWKEQKVAEEADPTDKNKVLAYADRLEARYDLSKDGGIEGVPTGIKTWDSVTGGLKRRRSYFIGGRPYQCKSVLWLQMAVHAAFTPRRDGTFHKVLLFSAEMTEDECYDRILAMRGVASAAAISSGLMSEAAFQKLGPVLGHLRNHLFIEDAEGLTVSDIARRTRKALRSHPDLDWIGVDYIQCLQHECDKKANSTDQVTQICRDLNRLKKTFNLPIVACASMNRAQEDRRDPTPKMSDLRQSGQIESDADVIALMNMDAKDEEGVDRQGEIIFAKVRGGSKRTFKVSLNKRFLLLEEPKKF